MRYVSVQDALLRSWAVRGVGAGPRPPGGPRMKTIRLTTAEAIVRYLIAQRTIDRRRRGAARAWRVRHLRPRQRDVPRPGAARRRRRAADLARPERAGHGARRHRLRQGDAPPAVHGRHQRRSVPARPEHGHGGRGGDGQPAAGAAAVRATRSRAGCPIPCCSRSSTSARRRRRPTTPSARRALLGPHHPPGAGRSSRCPRRRHAARSGRLRSGVHRPSRRTCRPRRSTSRLGSSSRSSTRCRRPRPDRGRGGRRRRRRCAARPRR